jgi:hypothetical protein
MSTGLNPVVLRIEPRALSILGKHSTIGLNDPTFTAPFSTSVISKGGKESLNHHQPDGVYP